MLRRVRVAGTDEFVLQRLELLLRSEFVCHVESVLNGGDVNVCDICPSFVGNG